MQNTHNVIILNEFRMDNIPIIYNNIKNHLFNISAVLLLNRHKHKIKYIFFFVPNFSHEAAMGGSYGFHVCVCVLHETIIYFTTRFMNEMKSAITLSFINILQLTFYFRIANTYS